MRGSGQHPRQLDVTPEGWIVADLKLFRVLAEHSPPRPCRYLDQLKADAGNWKPFAFWILGTGLLVAGAVTRQWHVVATGVLVLAVWFCLFRNVVRYFRECPVLRGTVEARAPHQVLQDYSVAQARLADGREIPVAFPSRMAASVLDREGRAEILILHNSRAEYSITIAARALADRGGPVTALGIEAAFLIREP